MKRIVFRCILAELFTKKAIFQGNVEHQQLEIIAYHCGSISPEVWPDVINLPNYHTMRPRGYHPRRIREKFTAYSRSIKKQNQKNFLDIFPNLPSNFSIAFCNWTRPNGLRRPKLLTMHGLLMLIQKQWSLSVYLLIKYIIVEVYP
jgi:hypothetical protein